MQQNIFINNVERVTTNLLFDKYYDFKLSKGLTYDYLSSFKPIASFDFSKLFEESTEKDAPKQIFSDIRWEGARNDGVILNHIGLTGYDNGLLRFEDSSYTSENIYEAFKNDTLVLKKGSDYDNFFMTRVFDNHFIQEKPIKIGFDEITGRRHLTFQGGFYQGFFKLEDECYQTLPTQINNEIKISLSIRPHKGQGLAEQNIFYIGTRAENKFSLLYNKDYKIIDNLYFLEILEPEEKKEDYLAENEYEKVIDGQELEDLTLDNGISINDNSKEAILTDNKFIFFNETSDGFNAETWNEGDFISLITDKPKRSQNLFPIMHYGIDGKTVDDIETIEAAEKKDYDFNKDIIENAFSIFITQKGEIGYKYLLKTCENEERIDIKTEKSKSNIIKFNQWNQIDIIFNKLSEGKMLISIYVNNFLKLISVNLPEIKLRALDDSAKKQETVPYNVSLGGGTDGLINLIFPEEYEIDLSDLILNKAFSNPFYGDIRAFNIAER